MKCASTISRTGVTHDSWGHPLAMTCTDQPGDQIVGAISGGPDGKLGTADDIASWQLGRDVTDLVRGGRWSTVPQRPAARQAVPAKPQPAALAPAKPADAPQKPTPTHVPTKPAPAVQLDENGLPITR